MKMPDRIGTRYNEDKNNMRTGWILEENTTDNILKAVEEAKEYISRKRTEEKKITAIHELMNLLDLLKAGVMICYPGYHGLPEWEPCMNILEDKVDILEKDEAHFEVNNHRIHFEIDSFLKTFLLIRSFCCKFIIIISFSNMIQQPYGMQGESIPEGKSSLNTLEKTKKLRLYVNFLPKDKVLL